MIGISMGILIGIVTGLVALLLIRTAWRVAANDVRSLLALLAEFLAIPTFWFGGSWVSGPFLQNEDLVAILPQYLPSLTCTFSLIALWPILQIVIALGREIGRLEGSKNDG